MFHSCLPKLSCTFGGGNLIPFPDEHGDEGGGGCSVRSVLRLDPSTGTLQIPSYTKISRADHCPLLRHAWGQEWDKVVQLCQTQPYRTLHVTQYSGRTALHLATFDRQCPLRVARALLKANRHMISVRDSNHYTPLHIVAFFSASASIVSHSQGQNGSNVSMGHAVATNRMGKATEVPGSSTTAVVDASSVLVDEEQAERARASELEAQNVMSLFCDTAIMVAQELERARGKHQEQQRQHLLEGTSPLYLAAKKGAPLSILKILLKTRSSTSWIAPSTGGEPYWYDGTGANHSIGHVKEKESTPAASFSSPLEILLREDRLRSSMNASYYHKNDTFLLGEEEDGNHGLRQTNSRSTSAFRAPDASTRLRIRPRPKNSNRRDAAARTNRSPLHPDEIRGVPHLIRAMQKLAINRCHEEYRHGDGDEESSKSREHAGNDDDMVRLDCNDVTNHSCSTVTPPLTHSQQRCLELWEKCVELLVTAGGSGIPLLVTTEGHTDEGENSRQTHNKGSVISYGILHACVCCKVPVPSLVEIALVLFPDQVYQRDALHGMIPLHHVLRAEHKYSYATSNLLAILLTGRATVCRSRVALSVKTTQRRDNATQQQQQQQQQQEPTAANTSMAPRTGRMPQLPSLANCTAARNSGHSQSLPNFPTARYFQSTALVPFPPKNDGQNEPIHPHHHGPIPLVYAIRLGLSMDSVINKLLEADSHESLRTLDPHSQLPPFALVATKIREQQRESTHPSQPFCSKSSVNHSESDDNMSRVTAPSIITPSTTTGSSRDPPNDIVSAAIGSTINALSSGDGSSEFSPATLSPSATVFTSIAVSNRNIKDDSTFSYQLDDVYRMLLAHPQVLAQYVAKR